jgi:hypothetical protein
MMQRSEINEPLIPLYVGSARLPLALLVSGNNMRLLINRKPPLKAGSGHHCLLLCDRRAFIGPLDESGQILAADTLGITLTLFDPMMHVGH